MTIRLNSHLREHADESARQVKMIQDLRAQLSSGPPAAETPSKTDLAAEVKKEIERDLTALSRTAAQLAMTPLSFRLVSRGPRGPNQPLQSLVIPPGQYSVTLSLGLDSANPSPTYRVVIQNNEDSDVWGEDVAPSQKDEGTLKLTVPARVFSEGLYYVLIYPVTSARSPERLENSYGFRVVRH